MRGEVSEAEKMKDGESKKVLLKIQEKKKVIRIRPSNRISEKVLDRSSHKV